MSWFSVVRLGTKLQSSTSARRAREKNLTRVPLWRLGHVQMANMAACATANLRHTHQLRVSVTVIDKQATSNQQAGLTETHRR